MTHKDALELLNMFQTAARLAQAKNQHEVHVQISESMLAELLKKAFPYLRNNINTLEIAKNILKNRY